MSREELIEKAQGKLHDAAAKAYIIKDYSIINIPEIMADFALSVMPRWIPVTTPPPASGWYRTNGNGDGCPVSSWDDDHGRFYDPHGFPVYPSHWQHITPEPGKEETK